jgi:hypothetical protein
MSIVPIGEVSPSDDAPTVIAIATLAFIVADVAHEVIGHGVAYLALGGRSFVLTTTRLIARGAPVDASGRMFVGAEHGDLYRRIYSLGGPLGGLLFAALAWLALRSLHRSGVRPRLFLWLTLAFNLLWNVGYLIYSGVTGGGYFAEGIGGALPAPVWRPLLLAAGLLLYGLSMRGLAGEIGRFLPREDAGYRGRVWRLLWISYWAAGVIACAGALFDPFGADQVYKSAAPASLLAAAGLLAVPRLLRRAPSRSEAAGDPVERSLGWILAALLASAVFVGLLGPGISASF